MGETLSNQWRNTIMPQPKTLNALLKVRGIMNEALKHEKGITITCDTKGQAFAMKMQCMTAKNLARKKMCQVFPEEHHLYNTCEWDILDITSSEEFLILTKMDDMGISVPFTVNE